MTDIATIGRRHLADALTGKLKSVSVEAWKDDDGNPIEIYWKPLTGAEEKQIQSPDTMPERQAMVVKVRARDSSGRLIFKKTSLASLMHDYDFNVIRGISFIITADSPVDDDQAEERQESIEKE